MRNHFISGILATLAIMATVTPNALAFSTSRYATTSCLASGKWVKIAVSNDGVYQITREQLAQMGFDDPTKVQIYGRGGHAISEVLDGSAIDDLKPVPIMVAADKLIFYGQGTIGMSLIDYTTSSPFYSRSFNPYSTKGYYFLTQTDTPTELTVQGTNDVTGNVTTSSLHHFLHEKELRSVGYTGKQFLGEDMTSEPIVLDYELPNICDSTVVVNISAAAYTVGYSSYIQSTITNGGVETDLEFSLRDSRIYGVSKTDVQRFYNTQTATIPVKMGAMKPTGKLKVNIYCSQATVDLAYLDYFSITYRRNNTFDNEQQGQFHMGYALLDGETTIAMPGVQTDVVVWDVTNPTLPKTINLTQTDENGLAFTPYKRTSPSEFVAFDPTRELLTIDGFENIDNQNLHAMSTPEMLIVTNDYFKAEAERLAQLHRDVDNMDVAVVTQDQIFNEFSSGTPDAMGVRLLCKMLYDRNSNKLKHLLMFGPAIYDYRSITTSNANRVITYESDTSESDEDSYASDDFFAMLDDNSGKYPVNDVMRISTARINPTTLEQARQDVDKIIHYVANPDYGTWRNSFNIIADEGKDDNNTIHRFQGQGIKELMHETLGVPMVAEKVFLDFFPKDVNESSIADASRRTPTEAKRHWIDSFNKGQYFATYMGHANEMMFSMCRLWQSSDVAAYPTTHLPIFSTACCDVARIDGNNLGVAEAMFHQPNGGAIALLTSSREVQAENNDQLNQAFFENVFSFANTGRMLTLGEAYMKAKQSSRVRYDANKMSFWLLGDPALKINYPKPYFRITSVNGVDVTNESVALRPMQQVTIEAQVMNPTGTAINTAANGDATISIYDVEQNYGSPLTKTVNRVSVTRQVTYPRELLVEVVGRVENGVFTGTLVMPRNIKASAGQTLAIHAYAHLDNSDEMVNGMTQNVTAQEYDAEQAVNDDQSPVINAMFINDEESFTQGQAIPQNSTLYITATDDVSFTNQASAVGQPMKLVLDNGKTYYTMVKNYSAVSDGGRTLNIVFPLTSLSLGDHSLTYYVQDAAGNATQRTITFTVGNESSVTLKSASLIAKEEANINLDQCSLAAAPALTMKVINAHGKVVRSENATLPYTWDLKDNDGQRVPAGLYRVYGNYNDGINHGGTNLEPVIVIDPTKTNQQ